MKYILSCPKPHTHFIELECIIENHSQATLELQLPAWRPGRYELQNFARNIRKWAAFDDNGNALKFRKQTKDSWIVDTPEVTKIHIRYDYYAAQLDAGACWLDENQLYVNPVHCFLYATDRIQEVCTVQLNIPEDYSIACGMEEADKHVLKAKDYHQLVDSPIIASNTLQHQTYQVSEVTFHIWFQGICKPDWKRITNDFKAFTEEQMKTMGSFPAKDYHFLIQVLPHFFYHGVEHLNATVLAIGPGYKLMENDIYTELLGLASHELFHAWNVKAIRPVEMMPYDYTKENYSRLGYVCEGVTTYYGDLFLQRCKVFNEEDYFDTFNKQLQKHFDNYGRLNLSVADSSFDTWLDGYVEGIPGRKTSIYTEGCLLAFLVDVAIQRETQNKKSLDDVMRSLYQKFGNTEKGYSEKDYQEAIESVSAISFQHFFDMYVNTPNDLENALTEACDYLQWELVKKASPLLHESCFGFKSIQNGSAKITHVAPGSPADVAGLAKDDEILAVNGIKIHNNLKEWIAYFDKESVTLLVSTQGFVKEKKLQANPDKNYYPKYTVRKKS